MPFGLRNAPSTFQRLMDIVLSGLDSFAVPYIDDVLVFSSTWTYHVVHLEQAMGRLSEAGLTVKPGKCLCNLNTWGIWLVMGRCQYQRQK